ncbi:MAG: UvrD-helicase domain-containing protein [Steroidobacteraceae bacterium]
MTAERTAGNAHAADEHARAEALDIRRSILLQAPAGSGKTTVLSQRYLKLLGAVAEPESILAITFTRKAAGELRARVLQALAGLTTADTAAARTTAELAAAACRRHPDLLENASRLKIMTIDAWNMSLASRLPITARSNVSLQLVDNPLELYQRAARETLRAAEQDVAVRNAFDRLLAHLDNDWRRLERLIAEMLATRNHWLPHIASSSGTELATGLQASLVNVIEETLARAMHVLGPDLCAEAAQLLPTCARVVRDNDQSTVRGYQPWLTNTGMLTAAATDVERWWGLTSLVLYADYGGFVNRVNVTKGIHKDDHAFKQRFQSWFADLKQADGALDALVDVAYLPAATIDDGTRQSLVDLSQVLTYAAQMLHVMFTETGECDHVAIAGAARQALIENGQPTDLAERLDLRLQHILVDEFQDTSHDQFALLETLVAGWSPGDGRTLFLVGDPMQSIYQFRNAEVGLFIRAREQGIGDIRLEQLALLRNFRSAHELVDQANIWFGGIFPQQDDRRFGAVRHLPSLSAARDRGIGRVAVQAVAAGGRAAEAVDIVRHIGALRARAPGETIAVLASSRAHTYLISEQLRAQQIPFSGVKLTPLMEVPVVRDLEALTRALLSLGDYTAWLASLRAPWCGLTLADLLTVVDAGKATEPAGEQTMLQRLRLTVEQGLLDAATHVRAEGFAQVITECLLERGRRSLAEWVESTWLRLDGPATCQTPDDLASSEAFFAALQTLERQGNTLQGSDIEALLEDLHAPGGTTSPDAVVVTTIFQAKGLEYDHVIVPGIGRRPQRDKDPLLRWLELPRAAGEEALTQSDLLLAPIKCPNEPDGELHKLIKRFKARRAAFERARVLYVALTRAKRSLQLYVHPQSDKDRVLQAARGTLLEPLWPSVSAPCNALTMLGAETAAAPVAPRSNLLRRLSTDWRRPGVPPDPVRTPLEIGSLDEALEYRWAGETARHIGTAVHAALETIAVTGAVADAARVAIIRSHLRADLAALGVPVDELEDATSVAESAIDRTLSDTRGRWILSDQHEDAASELALTGLENQRVVSVVIDRTFVDESGVRWVVDFKTSPHEGGSIEEFLREQTKRYRPQLSRYVRLLGKLKQCEVRAGLYFPLLAIWQECSLATQPETE